MIQRHWPEAANRRLRALMWKGCSLGEAAASMGRSLTDVSGQARRLGIRPLRFADDG